MVSPDLRPPQFNYSIGGRYDAIVSVEPRVDAQSGDELTLTIDGNTVKTWTEAEIEEPDDGKLRTAWVVPDSYSDGQVLAVTVELNGTVQDAHPMTITPEGDDIQVSPPSLEALESVEVQMLGTKYREGDRSDPDETVPAMALVYNTTDSQQSQDIDLYIDGGVVDTQSVTLSAGERQMLTFSFDETALAEDAELTARVATPNTESGGSIRVVRSAPYDTDGLVRVTADTVGNEERA